MENGRIIREGFTAAGLTIFGRVTAPQVDLPVINKGAVAGCR